ncbi:MAG: S-adenosylmethionine decarboxylase [Nanoarchaeota archaeon]
MHGCDQSLLKDPAAIQRFVKQLATKLKMHRVGPTEIKRFGHGKLHGYSMMQFIETSSITAHFDEVGGRAFLDVFSCRTYNPKIIAKFSQKFFKAESYTLYVEERK